MAAHHSRYSNADLSKPVMRQFQDREKSEIAPRQSG